MNYRQIFWYLVFGVLTTLVNIVVYFLCYNVLNLANWFSTVMAWLLSVLFAYLTNRRYVFASQASSAQAKLREIISFFGSRLGTGLLDLAIMVIAVDWLHLNALLWKIIANVIVIVLNYILSKYFVFKNSSENN